MKQFRRHALAYVLGLALVGVAYVSHASSTERGDAQSSTQQLHIRVPTRGATCGLPISKQVEAVNAFGEMMPVFEHDRCMNCHGKFDVLSTDEHTGAVAAKESKLDPRSFLTVPQRIAFHQGCGACHSQIQGKAIRRQLHDSTIVSGWMLPPVPMLWVGKDSEQLCVLMKSFEENADSFVSHAKWDHGEVQFVTAAFEGKRALDSANMDLYDVVPEPPPGTMSSLIAQATRWARLVDDHWNDSPECGCVMPKLQLKVHHTWLFDTPGGLPSRQSSDAQFEVDLLPLGDDHPGYFQGNIVVERRVDMKVPSDCTARASVKESWQFNVQIDLESGAVKVSHMQLPGDNTGEILCKHGGGTAQMGVDPEMVGGLGIGEMIIPPVDSMARKQGTIEGVRETLTITVRARPDK